MPQFVSPLRIRETNLTEGPALELGFYSGVLRLISNERICSSAHLTPINWCVVSKYKASTEKTSKYAAFLCAV